MQPRVVSASIGLPQSSPGAHCNASRGCCVNFNPLRTRSRTTQRHRERTLLTRAEQNEVSLDKTLEAELEVFMRQQLEAESGASRRNVDPTIILGADVVSEQEAKQYCRDIVRVLQALKDERDMSVAEVKLTISIEDPRVREQRESMEIEASLVSREELAGALMAVAEGRIPRDRIALRELHKEITNWPFLDLSSTPEVVSVEGIMEPLGNWKESKRKKKVGRDPSELPTGLEDLLPDWVGYSTLYVISVIPVLITIAAVAVLFFNSLR